MVHNGILIDTVRISVMVIFYQQGLAHPKIDSKVKYFLNSYCEGQKMAPSALMLSRFPSIHQVDLYGRNFPPKVLHKKYI